MNPIKSSVNSPFWANFRSTDGITFQEQSHAAASILRSCITDDRPRPAGERSTQINSCGAAPCGASCVYACSFCACACDTRYPPATPQFRRESDQESARPSNEILSTRALRKGKPMLTSGWGSAAAATVVPSLCAALCWDFDVSLTCHAYTKGGLPSDRGSCQFCVNASVPADPALGFCVKYRDATCMPSSLPANGI